MINTYDPTNPNSGHGHVYPRPDRAKARCGGPKMCDHCAQDKVNKEVSLAAPLPAKPKTQTNLVVGPDGFTESFSNDTVDVMVRMGLVKLTHTSSAYDWETRIYKATARPPMDIGGE